MTHFPCSSSHCLFPVIDGDTEVAARLAASPAAETMLNGTECDVVRHKSPSHDSAAGNNKTLLLVNENGTTDAELPHGSVTGSNGLVLAKPQQDGGSATPPGSGVFPHRTNWLTSGSPSGGHLVKPLLAPVAGCAQTSGALRTDPSTGTIPGQGTPDIKNGTASPPMSTPAAVTIHRARKTMSRPAVSPAQKVNIRERSSTYSTITICVMININK